MKLNEIFKYMDKDSMKRITLLLAKKNKDGKYLTKIILRRNSSIKKLLKYADYDIVSIRASKLSPGF
jgi:hypothetical protein